MDISNVYLALVARVLIATLFIYAGIINLTLWNQLKSVLVMKKFPFAGFLLSIAIVFEMVAALLIILGIYVKPLAFLLILFTVISIVVFHDFWNKPQGEIRSLHQGIFITHLTATLSALIFLIVLATY